MAINNFKEMLESSKWTPICKRRDKANAKAMTILQCRLSPKEYKKSYPFQECKGSLGEGDRASLRFVSFFYCKT